MGTGVVAMFDLVLVLGLELVLVLELMLLLELAVEPAIVLVVVFVLELELVLALALVVVVELPVEPVAALLLAGLLELAVKHADSDPPLKQSHAEAEEVPHTGGIPQPIQNSKLYHLFFLLIKLSYRTRIRTLLQSRRLHRSTK